jgi:hypothetical protein
MHSWHGQGCHSSRRCCTAESIHLLSSLPTLPPHHTHMLAQASAQQLSYFPRSLQEAIDPLSSLAPAKD